MGRRLLSSSFFFVNRFAAFFFGLIPAVIFVHFSVFVRSRFTRIDVYMAALIVLCDDYSHSSVCFFLLFFLSPCRGSCTEIEISPLGSLSAEFNSS